MLLRLTVAALLMLECTGMQATPSSPASPAATTAATPVVDPAIENLAKDWLLANQKGTIDRSLLSAWLDANFTPNIAKQPTAFFEKLGPLQNLSYVGSSTAVPGAHAHTGPPDTYYEFIATFTGKTIHWLVGIDNHGKIDGTTLWPYAAPLHLNPAQLVAELQTEMLRETAVKAFSGAVLVAKDGQPIFARAYGLSNREKNLPNALSTRFRMGSMNKMFTAVVLLQLVQAGKVGLDDTIGKYLTDYPNQAIASQVTVRELLTHTGGTGDIFGPEFDKNRLALRTLNDYVKLYTRIRLSSGDPNGSSCGPVVAAISLAKE